MAEVSYSVLSMWFLMVASLSSILLIAAVFLARRLDMLDLPGDRQVHTTPTFTGGGIGLISALIVSSLLPFINEQITPLWHQAVLPGLLVLTLVGWMDDRKSLSAIFRLLIQLAVSFGLLSCIALSGYQFGWLNGLLGAIAIVWIMNFYNFMDGSNGMAGFQGLFTGILLAVLFQLKNQPDLMIPAILVAASCAGFLPFNFPRPRVFMGDSGSVPLGFAIGALLAFGLIRDAIDFPQAILVLTVFLIDSSLTLINRVIRGERWYTPHKQHVYQRLIGQGWPHSRVLLLYQAVNVFFVVPVVMLATLYPEYAWPLTGTSFLLLTAGWYMASHNMRCKNERQ
ncbi:MAG: Fuc2NAc and GlcNAc transferase [Lysobacterales bacterium]|jgi:Fuc2NAc and GlcNAc transferase